jgi:hypothetical protein
MIRTGAWKYVYHTSRYSKHVPERELSDLGKDPGKFRNLAGKDALADATGSDLAEHERVMCALHALLVKEVGEEPESIEVRARADIAYGYKRSEGEAVKMNPEGYPEPRTEGDALESEMRGTM